MGEILGVVVECEVLLEVERGAVAIAEVEARRVVDLASRVEEADRGIPIVPGVVATAEETNGARVEQPGSGSELIEVVDPGLLIDELEHRLGVVACAGNDFDPACAVDEAIGLIGAAAAQPDRERGTAFDVPCDRVALAFGEATRELVPVVCVEIDGGQTGNAIRAELFVASDLGRRHRISSSAIGIAGGALARPRWKSRSIRGDEPPRPRAASIQRPRAGGPAVLGRLRTY